LAKKNVEIFHVSKQLFYAISDMYFCIVMIFNLILISNPKQQKFDEPHQLDLPPLPVSDHSDDDDNTEFTDDDYEGDDDDSNDYDIDENSGEGEDDTDENNYDTEINDAVDQNSVAGAANMDDD
jgi:hypothetical protein